MCCSARAVLYMVSIRFRYLRFIYFCNTHLIRRSLTKLVRLVLTCLLSVWDNKRYRHVTREAPRDDRVDEKYTCFVITPSSPMTKIIEPTTAKLEHGNIRYTRDWGNSDQAIGGYTTTWPFPIENIPTDFSWEWEAKHGNIDIAFGQPK